MMSTFSLLLQLTLLLLFYTSYHPTLADISISSPAQGASFAATSGITIKFSDDGVAPKFAAITSTKVLLCTGSNADINCLATVATFVPGSLTSYTVSLASYLALGSNGAYYFQLYSVATTGYTIHYSNRFTLSGMTGTLKASSGGDTTSPDDTVAVTDGSTAGAAVTGSAALASFSVTYTLQTGLTRYAPMQMQPGTKVTHKLSATRRFPTSSVSYFTTFTRQPLQKTTTTLSWSYTIAQGPNWAATAASPTGYYAASEALARNINAKSRRGYVDL